MSSKIKLNMGCGKRTIPGYIGVDKIKTPAADIVHDLNNFPYPFKKSSINEVLFDNVLEHLDNPISVMEEIYRICEKNAKVIVKVPYGKSDGAFKDPTHKNFFLERSFQYFHPDYKYNYYTNARFIVQERTLVCKSNNFGQKIRNLLPLKSVLKYFLWNVYDAIEFKLKCIK